MNKPIYKKITCVNALNKIKSQTPYKWDLNIYRGCEHSCKYCYALYSHKYLDSGGCFFDYIYIKSNIVEAFEKQLRSKSWNREIINIGGVTDSYQSIEKENKIMPEILKLLIKYKNPAIISTKSTLILRDYDLIDELSRLTYINIACTVTTTNENTRKIIEPFTSTSKERFNVLKTFRKTNASVGLHIMPIIPFITDSYENIDSLFSCAKDADVLYLLPGVLHLRGETKKFFYNFLMQSFPELYNEYIKLYKKGSADVLYKNQLYKMVNQLRNKYELSSSYMKPIKEKLHKVPDIYEQMSLFDL